MVAAFFTALSRHGYHHESHRRVERLRWVSAFLTAIYAFSRAGYNAICLLTGGIETIGRSPQRSLAMQVKSEFDLEEDEDFIMGPPKPFTSASASPSRQSANMAANMQGEHEDAEEVSQQEDRDQTPPYTGHDEDTPPYMPGDRDETPPYTGKPAEAEEMTPPYNRPSPMKQVENTQNIAADDEFELEEDPSFLMPSVASSQHEQLQPSPATEKLFRQGSVDYVQEDNDELEEDPLFLQTGPAAGPSSIPPSSPPVFSSPHTRNADTEDSHQHIVTEVMSPLAAPTRDRLDVSRVDLGRHVSRVREVRGTTFNGKTIKFKRQKGNGLVGELTTSTSTSVSESSANGSSDLGKLATSMLEKPIHILMDNIERDKALKDAAQREEVIHNNLVEAYGTKKQKGKARAGTKLGETWTDRYKPKKFTELLGDERTHRQAMSWLKEWDSCVFKTSSAAAIARKKQLKRARDGASVASGGFGGAGSAMESEDPLGRPREKVLLLTGPPGLGKTTLAHVIATQAGYRISEINASDDRSAKVVHDRIRQSLESTTITSLGSLSSSKPTCLIIDEIDGAAGGDAGFIKTLVRLVMEGSKVSHTNKSSHPNGKGKKKEVVPLQRPIICICNDLYVPALRPLRAIARIVRFTPPTNAMLVKRLKDICEVEQLRADHKSLTTLVEVAEGDMRSCLNTLQVRLHSFLLSCRLTN